MTPSHPGGGHHHRRRSRRAAVGWARSRSCASRSGLARPAARARAACGTSPSGPRRICSSSIRDAPARRRTGGAPRLGGRQRARAVEPFARPSSGSAPSRVDCLVLDSASGGRDAARRRHSVRDRARHRPVIAYGPAEWSERVESAGWSCRGGDVTVVRCASPERLLDQCSPLPAPAFTRPVASGSGRILERLHQRHQRLAGRKVLIVDDDIRNIFALTSVLERQHMVVVSAETGRDAISMLETVPGHRRGAHGRDDAGDGRLRDHARRSARRDPAVQEPARSSRSPPRP